MRTLVIGDIHGAYQALLAVLKKVNLQSNDTLIFLGDYVDGWSQSFEVIDYLIQLSTQHVCVFIKGNHDEWCEEWLRSGIKNEVWQLNGGAATVKSYGHYNASVWHTHLNFFERMVGYHVNASNDLFIHAGFTSMHGPTKEMYPSNYSWDRSLWETARVLDKTLDPSSKLYPQRLKLFRQLFIGHTPTTHYNIEIPMQGGNLWNLDTGAAFRGPLTVMDTETLQYWQSERVYTYYPKEQGRNTD